MPGQLLWFAARGGDHIDPVVAFAIGREGDPLSIRRETRVDLTGGIVGEASDAGAVFIGNPDVSQVAERYLSLRIGGVAEEFHLRGGRATDSQSKKKNGQFRSHDFITVLPGIAARGIL